MENADEKRHDSRSDLEGSVLCANFNMLDWSAARVVNCSRDGMYLISDTAYYPGAPVIIRTKNYKRIAHPSNLSDEMRQTTLAEVKWCKPAPRNPSVYEVGIRYYDSWY